MKKGSQDTSEVQVKLKFVFTVAKRGEPIILHHLAKHGKLQNRKNTTSISEILKISRTR